MSQYNVFTQWRHRLHFDHAADVREWFGYFRYDTSNDADIGIELNGMRWQGLMDAAEQRIPKLRPGFVPKVSELALAIHDKTFQEMHLCRQPVLISKPTATGTTEELTSHNNVVKAFSRAVAPDVGTFIDRVVSLRMTHPDRLPNLSYTPCTIPDQLPDDLVITSNGSTYRCKPGEKLRGSQVAFNEVELHVDELMKLVQDTPPNPIGTNYVRYQEAKLRELFKDSVLPASEIRMALRTGTNDIQFSTNQIAPQPQDSPWGRPYEEILAAVQKIEAWRAEQRSRQLTNSQIMQLCLHFQLYSLQAIQQFIEEYQR